MKGHPQYFWQYSVCLIFFAIQFILISPKTSVKLVVISLDSPLTYRSYVVSKELWRSNFRCGDYLQPSVISQTTKSLCTSRRNYTHMPSMSSYPICRPHFLSENPVFCCFSLFLVLLKLIYRFETHYTYEKLWKDSKVTFFSLMYMEIVPIFSKT